MKLSRGASIREAAAEQEASGGGASAEGPAFAAQASEPWFKIILKIVVTTLLVALCYLLFDSSEAEAAAMASQVNPLLILRCWVSR